MKETAQFIALISTGLLAGAFYYGTFTLIPSYYEIPISVHLQSRVALMNHNAVYMQLLTLAAIISPIWFAITSKQIHVVRKYAIAAAIAALISILITRIWNVPINHMMRMWDTEGAPVNWKEILTKWDVYNYARTAFAFASFVLIIIASQKINKT